MPITRTCPGSRQAGQGRSPVRRSAAACPARGPERASSSRRRQAVPRPGWHRRVRSSRQARFPPLGSSRLGGVQHPRHGRWLTPAGQHHSDSYQRKEDNPVPHIELNLVPTGEDMQEMALALMRAIIAAAEQDKDEMTVLLLHGEPAAVIAPYGHERRPGAAAEIAFDQTAPPEARLVLKDTWGGSIRMSTEEFRQLASAGVSPRFEAMAHFAESWP